MYDSFWFSAGRWLLPLIAFYIILGCGISLIRGNTKIGTLGYLVNAKTGEQLKLNGYETAIGHSYACDITLPYDTVSRFHAVLTKRGDRWLLFDTHSKTGTFVEEERVDSESLIPTEVQNGDIITFGGESFYFYDIDFLEPEEEYEEDDAGEYGETDDEPGDEDGYIAEEEYEKYEEYDEDDSDDEI